MFPVVPQRVSPNRMAAPTHCKVRVIAREYISVEERLDEFGSITMVDPGGVLLLDVSLFSVFCEVNGSKLEKSFVVVVEGDDNVFPDCKFDMNDDVLQEEVIAGLCPSHL